MRKGADPIKAGGGQMQVTGQNNYEDEVDMSRIENEFSIRLSWDSSNHFNVIFNEGGSVMFIYRDVT